MVDEKVYKSLDIVDTQKIASTSGIHEVYYCPMCEELTGASDNKGKLYYNTQKRIGQCFKCQTVYFGSDYIPSFSELSESFSSGSAQGGEEFTLKEWSHVLTTAGSSYLAERGFSEGVLDKFNIRSCEIKGLEALVIPDSISYHEKWGEVTNYLQVRLIDKKTPKEFRYVNLRDTKKPLMYSKMVTQPNLIICEGTFSAIAAYQHMIKAKVFDVVALLGKSLIDNQLNTIKDIEGVENIFICLDGGENAAIKKMKRVLEKEHPSAKIWAISLPEGKDPNDMTKEEFWTCLKNRS